MGRAPSTADSNRNLSVLGKTLNLPPEGENNMKNYCVNCNKIVNPVAVVNTCPHCDDPVRGVDTMDKAALHRLLGAIQSIPKVYAFHYHNVEVHEMDDAGYPLYPELHHIK